MSKIRKYVPTFLFTLLTTSLTLYIREVEEQPVVNFCKIINFDSRSIQLALCLVIGIQVAVIAALCLYFISLFKRSHISVNIRDEDKQLIRSKALVYSNETYTMHVQLIYSFPTRFISWLVKISMATLEIKFNPDVVRLQIENREDYMEFNGISYNGDQSKIQIPLYKHEYNQPGFQYILTDMLVPCKIIRSGRGYDRLSLIKSVKSTREGWLQKTFWTVIIKIISELTGEGFRFVNKKGG